MLEVTHRWQHGGGAESAVCDCIVYVHVQSLQQLEERRVGKVQEYIQKSADIENDAVPIINTCIAGIVNVAKTINPAEVWYSAVLFLRVDFIRCNYYH